MPKPTVAEKIARLIAELGWRQEDFAKRGRLHVNTVRQIVARPKHRLRVPTLHRCAEALGLAVHELTDLPLETLLARVRSLPIPPIPPRRATRRTITDADLAEQPALKDWLERHPDRAARLTRKELAEMISLQGTGGPLTEQGVEHFVGIIERKRELLYRIEVIAGTEYLALLEQVVDLLWERIQRV